MLTKTVTLRSLALLAAFTSAAPIVIPPVDDNLASRDLAPSGASQLVSADASYAYQEGIDTLGEIRLMDGDVEQGEEEEYESTLRHSWVEGADSLLGRRWRKKIAVVISQDSVRKDGEK